jgi:2-oxo-4-hydroxy-4-carboxy-5-ureidoimidazoline decarboxylase
MPEAHAVLAAMSDGEAARALARCCGARRWVEGMQARAPFATTAALLDAADAVWGSLDVADHLEAFSHHPLIGADLPGDEPGPPPVAAGAGRPAEHSAEQSRSSAPDLRATAAWAREEQAGAVHADAETRRRLRAGNQAYARTFGFTFIVCATGKSAREMLELLEARLHNSPETERRIAAREQAKITRLRLEKLATSP